MPRAADAPGGTDLPAEVAVIDGVASRPLAPHTDVATKAMLGELRRQGTEGAHCVVEVRRGDGGIVLEMWPDVTMTRTQAERVAAPVAQAVRAFDDRARRLDVTVHEPRRAETAAS
jgi:hypothetical protein